VLTLNIDSRTLPVNEGLSVQDVVVVDLLRKGWFSIAELQYMFALRVSGFATVSRYLLLGVANV